MKKNRLRKEIKRQTNKGESGGRRGPVDLFINNKFTAAPRVEGLNLGRSFSFTELPLSSLLSRKSFRLSMTMHDDDAHKKEELKRKGRQTDQERLRERRELATLLE